MRWWISAVFGGFGLILAVFAAGCGGQTDRIPEATPEMAQALGVEIDQLTRGRDHYMTRCGRCHSRVAPGSTEPESWRGIVPHMAEHAKLDATGENDLLLYLMAAHGTVHGADLEH